MKPPIFTNPTYSWSPPESPPQAATAPSDETPKFEEIEFEELRPKNRKPSKLGLIFGAAVYSLMAGLSVYSMSKIAFKMLPSSNVDNVARKADKPPVKKTENNDYYAAFVSTEVPPAFSPRPQCDPLVKAMARDGKISDAELITYGVQKGFFTVLSDEEFDMKQPWYNNLGYNKIYAIEKPQVSSQGNASRLSLQIDQAVNIDSAIMQMENDHARSLVIKDLRQNGRDVSVNLKTLKMTKATFLHSQKMLGLKNVPLLLTNDKHGVSSASSDIKVCLDTRELMARQDNRNFTINHELGHIKAFVTGKYKLFSKNILDHASENYADSIAAVLDPSCPTGSFAAFICCGENHVEGTISAFLTHFKELNQLEATDSHAPSLERVKRIMLISAKTFD